MAHSPSARKRVRQNQTHNERNRQARSRMRTAIKKLRLEATEGDIEKARAMLSAVESEIDRGAKRGIIKDNTAARYKSRLAKLLTKA